MKWRSLQESEPGLDLRPLREQYAERKSLIEKYVPAEARAISARAVCELRESGIVDRILPLGSHAPAFELSDHRGNLVSSGQLLRQNKLVIQFFRGRWCPFCVGQLEAMNQILPQIVEAGAVLIAISPQTVQQNFFMADQHRLAFPLLSDPGNRVAYEFGVAYRVPDYQQEIYRRAFINLPFANGDGGWELPIPATFIVDRDGRARYSSSSPDYTDRPEPLEILSALSR